MIAPNRKRRWRVVGYYDRFAAKGSSKFLGEPVPGYVVPGNQVVRSQPSIVRVRPDVFEVVHAVPRSAASCDLIPC